MRCVSPNQKKTCCTNSELSSITQLNEPFCQPFGNRRLLHCVPAPSAPDPRPLDPDQAPPHHVPDKPPVGEIPAWESCGRIPSVERYDFYEFVACNVLLATAALGMLYLRAKRATNMRAGRLAARIGMVGRDGRLDDGRNLD
jgi:hypothetical protein